MVDLEKALRGLQQKVAEAIAGRQILDEMDLSALGDRAEHCPEDMTVTVSGGIRLNTLQRIIREKSQWLPIDPPLSEQLSVHEVICWNLSGPRRSGFGSIRDYLIGMQMLTGSGELIRAGGKVVKNVAGYDLCKLAVGSEGSIGWITEATFKLIPTPEAEEALEWAAPSLEKAEEVVEQLLSARLSPVTFDAYQLGRPAGLRLRVEFAGPRPYVAEAVASSLRILPGAQRSAADKTDELWRMELSTPSSLSVAPSAVFSTLRTLGDAPWVARLGAGLIYHRSENGTNNSRNPALAPLFQRIKQTFDPASLLPTPAWM